MNRGLQEKMDVEMGDVIYGISADRSLKDKAELRESKFTTEGFEHIIIKVYSPQRANGIGDLMGLASGMSLDLPETTLMDCLGILTIRQRDLRLSS